MDSIRKKREIDRLERDVEELRRLASKGSEDDLERLHREVKDLKREFYQHLGAWQRTQLARHAHRPYTLDYITVLFEEWSEVHGDRGFADDPAIVAGLARFHGQA